MGLHIGYKCKCQQNLVKEGHESKARSTLEITIEYL